MMVVELSTLDRFETHFVFAALALERHRAPAAAGSPAAFQTATAATASAATSTAAATPLPSFLSALPVFEVKR